MNRTRTENTLRFLYLNQAFRQEAMDPIIRLAEGVGFGQATFVDGSPRDNVQTVFFDRTKKAPLGPVFDRVIELSDYAAQMFDIEVWAKKLSVIQIARYLPGDHYYSHVDHDTGLENLGYDRKLSFFCSISPGGQMEVEGEHINLGCGDALIFPATMHHAAPLQGSGTRYSFVAWVPGPPWR